MNGKYRKYMLKNGLSSGELGAATWLFVVLVAISVLLMLAVGFYEGRKLYWDNKVRDMCAKDGGLTVLERVSISRRDFDRLGGKGEMIPIPSIESASAAYPFVTKTVEEVVNGGKPRVYKEVTSYLRASDKKLLAKTVRYWRVGGDLPTFGHPTQFSCPDQKRAVADERSIFNVEGGAK